MDTASNESFIGWSFVQGLHLLTDPDSKIIFITSTSLTYWYCLKSISRLRAWSISLGQNLLKWHQSIYVNVSGEKPSLNWVATFSDYSPWFFANIINNCSPAVTKSRKFNSQDKCFIATDVKRLLAEAIIELTTSWWVQVVMTTNEWQEMVYTYFQCVMLFHIVRSPPPPPRTDKP